MKCILDLESAINLRIEVEEHNYDKVKLSLKDDLREYKILLNPKDADDLSEMLKQVSMQVKSYKL